MQTYPQRNGKNIIAPHVVILGAGASLAAFPNGDKNGKILPLMNNIIQILELEHFIRDSEQEYLNFEDFYSDLTISKKEPILIKLIEDKIYDYFSVLEITDNVNIYDYLILSLRETDIIATFNWDPFLLQAYHRNMNLSQLPKIVFLHGNVAIGVCYNDSVVGNIGNICLKCGRLFQPSRLMYPVKQKEYNSDPYIHGEWKRLNTYLKNSYFLTIYGYSAPSTDIEAKNLLLNAWKESPSLGLNQINIIDIKSENEVEENWKEFFVRQHYSIWNNIFESWLFLYPRRSCEALASFTLENECWQKNKFPNFNSLEELHQWILPLVIEETNCKIGDTPLSSTLTLK